MAQSQGTGKIKSTVVTHEKSAPYVRGFTPRPKKERLEAIGFDVHNIPRPFSPVPEEGFFTQKQRPTSVDDWLAQNREDGQTYRGFQWQSPWLAKRCQRNMTQTFVPRGKTILEKYPDGKIYIVPVGEIDQSYIELDDLVEYVRRFLCIPVTTCEGLQIVQKGGKMYLQQDIDMKDEIETRYNEENNHIQISISALLPRLKERLPEDALCIVGLTTYDLYGDDADLFMAGLAPFNENTAVFSIYRYNPKLTFSTEFWYEIKESVDVAAAEKKWLILQRSCKLIVHEICHILGIDHCVYFECCMNGSGHLEEDFRQPMHLCPVDLHKLHLLTGCDVVDRYERLSHFYTSHGMQAEADWVKRRVQFIQGKGKANAKTKKKTGGK